MRSTKVKKKKEHERGAQQKEERKVCVEMTKCKTDDVRKKKTKKRTREDEWKEDSKEQECNILEKGSSDQEGNSDGRTSCRKKRQQQSEEVYIDIKALKKVKESKLCGEESTHSESGDVKNEGDDGMGVSKFKKRKCDQVSFRRKSISFSAEDKIFGCEESSEPEDKRSKKVEKLRDTIKSDTGTPDSLEKLESMTESVFMAKKETGGKRKRKKSKKSAEELEEGGSVMQVHEICKTNSKSDRMTASVEMKTKLDVDDDEEQLKKMENKKEADGDQIHSKKKSKKKEKVKWEDEDTEESGTDQNDKDLTSGNATVQREMKKTSEESPQWKEVEMGTNSENISCQEIGMVGDKNEEVTTPTNTAVGIKRRYSVSLGTPHSSKKGRFYSDKSPYVSPVNRRRSWQPNISQCAICKTTYHVTSEPACPAYDPNPTKENLL